jgi:hypothetical protein
MVALSTLRLTSTLFMNEWHGGNLRFGSSPLLIKLQTPLLIKLQICL